MRLKGSMTIEATYIFPFITFLVAAFIMMDFKLYDAILNDSVKILGSLRYNAASTYYYNKSNDNIDYIMRISAPVISENTSYSAMQKISIYQNMHKEYENGKLRSDDKMTSTDISQVIKPVDNANRVRAGGKIVQIIGG